MVAGFPVRRSGSMMIKRRLTAIMMRAAGYSVLEFPVITAAEKAKDHNSEFQISEFQ